MQCPHFYILREVYFFIVVLNLDNVFLLAPNLGDRFMCEAMAKGSLSGLCSHRLAYVGHAAWKILRAGPAQVLRQESQRT